MSFILMIDINNAESKLLDGNTINGSQIIQLYKCDKSVLFCINIQYAVQNIKFFN